VTKESSEVALQGSEAVVLQCVGHCPAAPGKAGMGLLGQVTRCDGHEGVTLPRAGGQPQQYVTARISMWRGGLG